MKKEYILVRSSTAGVFAGTLRSRNGQEVVLDNARRIWYWKGAASLSQMSVEGVSEPKECKFPCEVPYVILSDVCEILPVSKKAEMSIKGVPVWRV